MTSKVDPRTVRVNIFIIAYTHKMGIQMNQKELTKTFMTISKKTLLSLVYTEVFQRFKR